ncbi:LysE family translocator [Desertibaculum subflavum]|uniref:LysE family translocator n=1 Tax=Desertibaculum subflavum TaxID=2268458 RepID=UPI000E665DD4
MPIELYLAYVVACFAITAIPGPTVTLIVANSLTHGTRAGLLNVAGTQVGLGLMMATLVVGLASVIEAMGWWFDWLRLAGAAYLVWLGWKLIRASGEVDAIGTMPRPRGGFFLQGLLVMLSNPKALVFFGAFIPQFVDPAADHRAQVVLLGLTAMAMALATDGAYAVLTGRAGRSLSRARVRLVSRLSGGCLIGGGLWLALSRSR